MVSTAHNAIMTDTPAQRPENGPVIAAWLKPLAALLLLGQFAPDLQAAKKTPTPPPPARVWPNPPAEPRITFVASIGSAYDIGGKPSIFSRIGNAIIGSKKADRQFVKPQSLNLDDQGNICLTDTGTGSIYVLDRAKHKAQRWDKAGKKRFINPVAMAKRKDLMFVAEPEAGAVLAVNTKGKLLFEIRKELQWPAGLAISGDKLLVADARAHRIAVFDLKGNFIRAFGKRGVAPGEFNFPTHLAVDPAGRVFVTDSMNFRVQIFGPDGTFESLLGSQGDTSGHLSRPKGVAVDKFGHVYVVDALFDNFQIFDQQGRFLLDVGTPGSGPGDFWLPSGITFGGDNTILVADSYNHRVQVFQYLGKE